MSDNDNRSGVYIHSGQKTNIALIGFMGSGKSTVARELAALTGFELIEMDSLIEKREGMTITEIFEKKGEEYFRSLETGLLRELSAEAHIISCGGGVAMRQENVDIIRQSGVIVYLRTKPETIYHRVKNKHNRPLIEHNKTPEYIAELLSARIPKYEAAADITLDTDNTIPPRLAEKIASVLRM